MSEGFSELRGELTQGVFELQLVTNRFKTVCVLLNKLEDTNRLQHIEIIRLRDTISELQGKKSKK
jgi:hypothetical protein